jgi:hypothetical protein
MESVKKTPKVRAWMYEHGYSIKKMSEESGIGYTILKSRLAGYTQWKLDEVNAILNATGETFEALFK